jgi:hypothetical protein
MTPTDEEISLLHTAAPPSKRLSVELLELAEAYEDLEVSLHDLMEHLAGRVYTLMLVLLSLPFCQPIGIPGLSTPFGAVIALLGLRFALQQKPWLPRLLTGTKIPRKFLPPVLRVGSKILRAMEKVMHPRISWFFVPGLTQFATGAVIFVCGSLLLLPLPIPFSNLLPALTILLLAASYSERDGIMLIAGAACFVLTLVFFGVLLFGSAEALIWLKIHFNGIFDPKEAFHNLPGLEGGS